MSDTTKPAINFTIICDDIRQEEGGKISLMGLFENIYATRFPAVHPRLAILTEWGEGKGEFEIKTKILSPDRKIVLRETASQIKLSGANIKHRDISVHLNLEFKTPGVYWIENYLDGEMINSVPLNIVHVKEGSVH
jgi:hypothetical protein